MGLPLACLVAVCLALALARGSELQEEARTRNHVCSTWGNFHYKTFDGDVFRFPGLCDYNFASDCRDSYKEFAVHLKRGLGQAEGHPQVESVLITIKDDTIYLTHKLAVVNGALVSTPHYSSGLLIEKNDAYTKVYSRAGLSLMWNREDALMLELDSRFQNHTCGLCGDFNGMQTYYEFLSEGIQFSATEFGNMQKINKPEVTCEDPEEVSELESCSEHRAECERLLTSAAFEDCQARVPVELYVRACMQDRCQCPQGGTCECSTLAEFSRQCSHAGGRPDNWRTASLCPKSCPENMVYLESSSPCVDTCSHLEVSSLCEEHYMDGCFCPEGTVYDDITSSGCIPVGQCHCKLHGHLYTPGQEITNECEHCVCNAGRWECEDLPCPETCALEGGSHITTFDGKKFTFHGDCYYVLTKGNHNVSFALLGELAPCGSTDKQTCLKTVVLLTDNKKNVVAFKSDGSVLLNELEVTLPHVAASFSIFQPSSFHIIVNTVFGLRLQVQLVPVMQLFVTLDQAAQGQVQGLCGNFNGLESDDFMTSGGMVEATGAGFANTWKAQSSCHDKLDWLDDPCSLNIESANYAEHWCSLLKKSETPFARCHLTVDPTEYYKRCKYDTCNCQNNEDCMCAALSSYARACAAKGVMLWGWREHVCNKDVQACPNSQIFLYNLTTCQQTCRSLSEGNTHCFKGFAPVEGCGCPDHTFLDEKGRCVPLAKCSCYHHGLYLEAGDVILRQEERCVCRNGRLQCSRVMMIGQECVPPKILVDCNNLTALAIRKPRPISCQTLVAGYYHTECISGCVCPDGLLDNGRGDCVVEEKCPCFHNKDLYPSGARIKLDCNNTCVCQKGLWECTQYACHSTCSIYGNGHYITFDGKHYDFDGHCSYVAVQDYCGQNSTGSFSIITENVPCGTTGVTCSKAIKIFIGGTELKLVDKHRVVKQLEDGHHVPYITREVGLYLVVEASSGIIVIWDKKTTIFIKLAPSYKGTVCGLCGNFDGQTKNDFTTRDHMVVTSELDFGNSWKEASTCPDVKNTLDPCSLNPHRRSWAEKQCSIIKSRVFRVCHSKVDPTVFYEACVFDSCSCDTGGDCDCFCSAVASYAQECTKAGACVFWRTPDLCPVFCDYYNPPDECKWHYEPCGNHSFETCRTVKGIHSNISVSYLEGCYPRCPKDRPIYDEDRKKCVTEDKCGCYIEDTLYPPGASVPNKNICMSCVCNNTSEITCQYDEGKILNMTQDGVFCYWEICGPNGTVEQHFNICGSSTPPFTSTTVSTTTTATTSTTPFTTTIVTTTFTPVPSTSPWCCVWSDWINRDHPTSDSDDGDRETFEDVCSAPEDIECRSATEPHLSLKELGQNVQCNVTTGFTCKNEDQYGSGVFERCYDYEIRVNCCLPMEQCPTSSPPTSTSTAASTTSPTTPPTTSPTTPPTSSPTTPPTSSPTTPPTSSPTTPSTTPSTTPPTTSPTTPPTSSPTTTTTSPTTPTTSSTTSPTTTPTTPSTTPSTTPPTTSPTTPPTSSPTTTTTSPTTPPTTSPSTPSTTPSTTLPTTSPTTPPTTSPSTPSTIPSTTPRTTSHTTTTLTPTTCINEECWWTNWVDGGKPPTSSTGGDFESIEGVCTPYEVRNISCRAVMYPDTPIAELGQKVVCDTSVGLVCKNEDQKIGGPIPMPFCLNYEINVQCCKPEHCITSSTVTVTITTTPETTTTTQTTPETMTPTPITTLTTTPTPTTPETTPPTPTTTLTTTTNLETMTPTLTLTVTTSTTPENTTPTPTIRKTSPYPTTETTTPVTLVTGTSTPTSTTTQTPIPTGTTSTVTMTPTPTTTETSPSPPTTTETTTPTTLVTGTSTPTSTTTQTPTPTPATTVTMTPTPTTTETSPSQPTTETTIPTPSVTVTSTPTSTTTQTPTPTPATTVTTATIPETTTPTPTTIETTTPTLTMKETSPSPPTTIETTTTPHPVTSTSTPTSTTTQTPTPTGTKALTTTITPGTTTPTPTTSETSSSPTTKTETTTPTHSVPVTSTPTSTTTQTPTPTPTTTVTTTTTPETMTTTLTTTVTTTPKPTITETSPSISTTTETTTPITPVTRTSTPTSTTTQTKTPTTTETSPSQPTTTETTIPTSSVTVISTPTSTTSQAPTPTPITTVTTTPIPETTTPTPTITVTMTPTPTMTEPSPSPPTTTESTTPSPPVTGTSTSISTTTQIPTPTGTKALTTTITPETVTTTPTTTETSPSPPTTTEMTTPTHSVPVTSTPTSTTAQTPTPTPTTTVTTTTTPETMTTTPTTTVTTTPTTTTSETLSSPTTTTETTTTPPPVIGTSTPTSTTTQTSTPTPTTTVTTTTTPETMTTTPTTTVTTTPTPTTSETSPSPPTMTEMTTPTHSVPVTSTPTSTTTQTPTPTPTTTVTTTTTPETMTTTPTGTVTMTPTPTTSETSPSPPTTTETTTPTPPVTGTSTITSTTTQTPTPTPTATVTETPTSTTPETTTPTPTTTETSTSPPKTTETTTPTHSVPVTSTPTSTTTQTPTPTLTTTTMTMTPTPTTTETSPSPPTATEIPTSTPPVTGTSTPTSTTTQTPTPTPSTTVTTTFPPTTTFTRTTTPPTTPETTTPTLTTTVTSSSPATATETTTTLPPVTETSMPTSTTTQTPTPTRTTTTVTMTPIPTTTETSPSPPTTTETTSTPPPVTRTSIPTSTTTQTPTPTPSTTVTTTPAPTTTETSPSPPTTTETTTPTVSVPVTSTTTSTSTQTPTPTPSTTLTTTPTPTTTETSPSTPTRTQHTTPTPSIPESPSPTFTTSQTSIPTPTTTVITTTTPGTTTTTPTTTVTPSYPPTSTETTPTPPVTGTSTPTSTTTETPTPTPTSTVTTTTTPETMTPTPTTTETSPSTPTRTQHTTPTPSIPESPSPTFTTSQTSIPTPTTTVITTTTPGTTTTTPTTTVTPSYPPTSTETTPTPPVTGTSTPTSTTTETPTPTSTSTVTTTTTPETTTPTATTTETTPSTPTRTQHTTPTPSIPESPSPTFTTSQTSIPTSTTTVITTTTPGTTTTTPTTTVTPSYPPTSTETTTPTPPVTGTSTPTSTTTETPTPTPTSTVTTTTTPETTTPTPTTTETSPSTPTRTQHTTPTPSIPESPSPTFTTSQTSIPTPTTIVITTTTPGTTTTTPTTTVTPSYPPTSTETTTPTPPVTGTSTPTSTTTETPTPTPTSTVTTTTTPETMTPTPTTTETSPSTPTRTQHTTPTPSIPESPSPTFTTSQTSIPTPTTTVITTTTPGTTTTTPTTTVTPSYSPTSTETTTPTPPVTRTSTPTSTATETPTPTPTSTVTTTTTPETTTLTATTTETTPSTPTRTQHTTPTPSIPESPSPTFTTSQTSIPTPTTTVITTTTPGTTTTTPTTTVTPSYSPTSTETTTPTPPVTGTSTPTSTTSETPTATPSTTVTTTPTSTTSVNSLSTITKTPTPLSTTVSTTLTGSPTPTSPTVITETSLPVSTSVTPSSTFTTTETPTPVSTTPQSPTSTPTLSTTEGGSTPTYTGPHSASTSSTPPTEPFTSATSQSTPPPVVSTTLPSTPITIVVTSSTVSSSGTLPPITSTEGSTPSSLPGSTPGPTTVPTGIPSSPKTTTGPTKPTTVTPTVPTSTIESPTQTRFPSTILTTPKTTKTSTWGISSSVTPITFPDTATLVTCCVLNEVYYGPGELVYNNTHGDICYYVNCSLSCEIQIFNWSCPSTLTPTPSTPTTTPSTPTTTPSTPTSTPSTPTTTPSTPTSTSPKSTPGTPATTKPPACLDFDPPRQENETWWLCNCTMAICKHDNVVELVEMECKPPPMPTCSNGLKPVRVVDPDGCCWHWECDCYCTGWGDPHYVTFDGLYYSYQGNCTYVLVEEIIPTVDNFGIYIDNYHCDVNDKVSCPRTLIVRHETQEVLIKTVKIMPMKVQIQVNKQAVALPYKKYGLEVYESGINFVVDIPRLGAQVSYNGLSFSIRLPYHLFGNNTQGQCGTCTNNTADDCILPSGEIISNCEISADEWGVDDPSKPQCSYNGFTTQSPSITTLGSITLPDNCTVSPVCQLIKDSLFSQCHPLVPPKHYYEACLFDSCFVPGFGLECASVQAYASLCAQEGACIDWRSHTQGACSVECPSHRVYQACGPADEPTCQSGSSQNSTRLVEGCFCPEGTTKFAPGYDVCVTTCGCVGLDNVPREFGEQFEFDCKNCVCLEGGSGIVCQPKECSGEQQTTCEEDGTYPVTEVNPADICCNITSCKCDPKLCKEKSPSCSLGFEVQSQQLPGQCCPIYSCVPKGVCVHQKAEYQPGSPVHSSKCQDCVCTDIRDNSTQLNVISCTPVPCNISCSSGFELMEVTGECCGKCQQTHCIIKRPDQQQLILKPGDIQKNPSDECTFYSCMKISNQLISSISNITCPDFDPSDCIPDSITFMPNGCCKTCIPQNYTRVPCSAIPVKKEISHNGCTKNVTMNYCSGSCGTSAMYSAEAQALDHRCSCCKEERTSEREVALECPDGSELTHTYTHIESCLCQDTVCELPQAQQVRVKRSNPRLLGRK